MAGLAVMAVNAAEFKECKTIPEGFDTFTPYNDGFLASIPLKNNGYTTNKMGINNNSRRAKTNDSYAVSYINRGQVKKMFDIPSGVSINTTEDGKYYIFVSDGGITVVNAASKKSIFYEIENISQQQIQVANGFAYGVNGNGLFKVRLDKQEKTIKPFDNAKHSWQNTWQVDGKIYILAADQRASTMYVLPIDESLNVGTMIPNKVHGAKDRDSTVSTGIGYIASGEFQSKQRLINLLAGKTVNEIEIRHSMRYIGVNHDCSYLIEAFPGTKTPQVLSIYRHGTNAPEQTINGVQNLLAFSSSGNDMVLSMADGSTKLYCR
jgi:hypothetical protein